MSTTTWKSAPAPRIIRVSYEDFTEEQVDLFQALRSIRDAYPDMTSDQEIIKTLEAGMRLQGSFKDNAYYRIAR